MRNGIIEIMGFAPSRDLLSFLEDKMDWLEAVSPTGSHIKLAIVMKDQDVHGQLTINSEKQNFRAEIQDQSIVTVVLHLINDIEKQISRWKRLRFSLDPYLKKAN